MNKLVLLTLFLFYSASSIALLPPYYESAKEIIAILSDARVAEKITSGRVINSITKTESGYMISAGTCTLQIKIKYLPLPNGMVGPAVFEIEPGELNC